MKVRKTMRTISPQNLLLLLLMSAGAMAAVGKCTGTTTANDVEQELGQDMTGRVVFATGGDSGIGLSALTAIASANATIVIASLSPTAGGAAAKAAIVNATGNTKVTVLPLDLSDFESVRSCAAAFAKQHDALDVLINDAGIDHCPSSLAPVTADGFERVFQVNYLGHFLLTQQLLPALKRAPAPRVINVASGAHASACPWAAASSNCLDISELPPPVRKVITPASSSVSIQRGTCRSAGARRMRLEECKAFAEADKKHFLGASTDANEYPGCTLWLDTLLVEFNDHTREGDGCNLGGRGKCVCIK